MRIKYREIKLNNFNKMRLDVVNEIIDSYLAQNYKLTLRQLYYQLVARDIITNNVKEYAKLSNLIKEGRMGGVVDWNAIEDRLREPDIPSHWNIAADIIETTINAFRVNRQQDQPNYIEVFVEKDALSGVLKRVTRPYGIPITVNRGYSSATAMHDVFKRIENAADSSSKFEKAVILYVGDFDPSGLDMIRDVENRILDFIIGSGQSTMIELEIYPIALTYNQIEKYNPPPNPAKKQDPRAKDFIRKYGTSSWEVDALKPEVLHSVLDNAIKKFLDIKLYNKTLKKEVEERRVLSSIHNHLSESDSDIWTII